MTCLIKRVFSLVGITILITTGQGFAQNNDKDHLLKERQLKGNVDIFGVNMSYETRIGKGLTAYFDGGITYCYYI